MLNFKIFRHFLSKYQNIVIISHENPDIDSISSTIALENLLTEMGKRVLPYYKGRIPTIVDELDYRKIIKERNETEFFSQIDSYAIIIVDTNDSNNLGVEPHLLENAADILVIDHHSYKSSRYKNLLIDVSASSTCEIVYRIYRSMEIELPAEVAKAIYAGIVYDTGFFCYPKTSTHTFETAAELVRKGACPNDIYLLLNENESIGSLKIHRLVLNTLELHSDDQVALMTLTDSMLEEAGARYEDTAELINIPLKSEKVKISVFLKESPGGKRKVSLRSKGPLDMADIAFNYGGGGHRNSAGFKLSDESADFKVIKAELLVKLDNLFTM